MATGERCKEAEAQNDDWENSLAASTAESTLTACRGNILIEPRGLEEAVGGAAHSCFTLTHSLGSLSLLALYVPHSIHPHYIPAGRIVFVYERAAAAAAQPTEHTKRRRQTRCGEKDGPREWKIIYYYLAGVDPV